MTTTGSATGRLSTVAAALVIARRDFTAVLFSRSFIFFLLGPLFPVFIAVLAGGIGQKVQENVARPVLGVAMPAADAEALIAARSALAPHIGAALPEFIIIQRLAPDEPFDPAEALKGSGANLAAIASGTLEAPVLTGPRERIAFWQGPVSMVAAHALDRRPQRFPTVSLSGTATTTTADRNDDRMRTAQASQTLLFLLTMLLAGMVLSNLVEEKGNKIIEILAAAIPMDAVFLGKLFAMLAISLLAIAVWGSAGGLALIGGREALPAVITAPAVGWPLFLGLGVAYFSLAYLLIGSVFLAIGSMATTVREVQTLSLPATMLQLFVFLFATYAMTRPGTAVELAAMIVPFSSPFSMLARAAQDSAVWPHLTALAWQVLWVAILVRLGARLFRTRVMKSGPQGRGLAWRRLFARKARA